MFINKFWTTTAGKVNRGRIIVDYRQQWIYLAAAASSQPNIVRANYDGSGQTIVMTHTGELFDIYYCDGSSGTYLAEIGVVWQLGLNGTNVVIANVSAPGGTLKINPLFS